MFRQDPIKLNRLCKFVCLFIAFYEQQARLIQVDNFDVESKTKRILYQIIFCCFYFYDFMFYFPITFGGEYLRTCKFLVHKKMLGKICLIAFFSMLANKQSLFGPGIKSMGKDYRILPQTDIC